MPDDDEDGGDSDDSDRKSKMSFSYWGADKITVQKPVIKARGGAPVARRGGGSVLLLFTPSPLSGDMNPLLSQEQARLKTRSSS